MRFDFTILVPAIVALKAESDNGDGRTSASSDGRIKMLVFGANMLLDEKGKAGESLGGHYLYWQQEARKKGASEMRAAYADGGFSVQWREKGRSRSRLALRPST